MDVKQLNAIVEERKDELFNILCDLIKINSENFGDHESIKDMVQSAKDAVGNDVLVCVSCLSDLSVILKYGNNSAYGFGAERDFSLAGGAHQPDEFIECDRLINFAKTVGAYLINFLG